MDISIIIPVCNEEDNTALIFKEIKNAFSNYAKSYELIFVNDGSSDNSLNILKDITDSGSSAKIISFDKNYGKTSALDAGFKHAKGEIVLTIDADLQYDPNDLLKIIAELEDKDIDAVLGRRINKTSGFIKGVCSKTAIFVRNIILKEYYQGCYLAGYRRLALENLILYRGFQDFIPSLLKMQGYNIKEISVKEYPRKYGRSKYGIMNRFFKGLCALLVIKWMKDNRLRYRIIEDKRLCLDNCNVQRYFDIKASGYLCGSKKGLWNIAKQKEKSAILKMLEPGFKDLILDAGCGSGYYLSALAEKGYKAEGIDFSSNMAAEARRHGFKVSEVDIEKGMGHDEQYDKIICAGVLEFCKYDSKALMNLKNILKREGIIILLLPSASFYGFLYRIFHRFFGCRKKINLYNMDRISRLLEACDLKACGILYPTPYSMALRLCKK